MLGAASSHAFFGGREPGTYADRKGSRNARYDSLFGHTYSLRTNRASRSDLEKAENDLAKSQEDRDRRRDEDRARLFKKLGIIAPTGLAGQTMEDSEANAFASLQRYRMGAEQSSATTPGLGLSLATQRALSSRPPGSTQAWLSPQHSDIETPPSSSSLGGQMLFQPPPVFGVSDVPPGWFKSPNTGWYYVPPNQLPTTPAGMVHQNPHLPSSMSIVPGPSSSSPTHPHFPMRNVVARILSDEPEPAKLKGILKYASSDPSNPERRVRFRATPDVAPTLSRASSCSSVLTSSSLSTPPPTLPAAYGAHNTAPRNASHDTSAQSDVNGSPQSSQLGELSASHQMAIHTIHKASDVVPNTLRVAHARLLRSDADQKATSGKRSGRTLVRELERIADAVVNSRERKPNTLLAPRHKEIIIARKRSRYVEDEEPECGSDGGPNIGERRDGVESSSSPESTSRQHQRFEMEFGRLDDRDLQVAEYAHRSDASPSPDLPETTFDLRNEHAPSPPIPPPGPNLRQYRSTNQQRSHPASQMGSQSSQTNATQRPRTFLANGDFDHGPDGWPSRHLPTLDDKNALSRFTESRYSLSSDPSDGQPEPKRMRLTERAWQYEIPIDKLPSHPSLKAARKLRAQPTREPLTVMVDRASQISQIEVSDEGDSQELTHSSQHDETIDGSWPPSQSQRLSQTRLSTIDEADEPLTAQGHERQDWAEHEFFQGDGRPGFRIWRDGY